MQMTSRIAPFNPPRNISDQERVNRMLEKAGISNGQYNPTGANLTELSQQALKDVTTHAAKPENTIDLENGWVTMSATAQGDYGLDYKMRYYVASVGYLALTATEAMYPNYQDPTNGNSATLHLEPDQAYMFTFASKPPLTDVGFWSITGYNADQYLIDNSLDRYALGDRSDITYPDGSLVYGTDGRNESFQILVQPGDVVPPKNWTAK